MAAIIYDRPREGRVFGDLDFDVEETQIYIQKRRQEGVKLTITPFFVAAVARTIAEDCPSLNVYLLRGKVRTRESIDVMVSVNIKGQSVSAVKIRNADQKTVSEISDEIRAKTVDREALARTGVSRRSPLLYLPWFVRKPVFRVLRWIALDLGIPLKPLGLHPNMLGSLMITNIGSFGLKSGFAALMPAANVPIVLAPGAVTRMPRVVEDEICARHILPVTGTLDHRLFDGSHIGGLGKGLRERLRDPKALDSPPRSAE
jgi:pyruvate/2-oxoglutarate dehydrogenase complex dihydrolipoamide acyltransferase (E2) component